MFSEKTKTKIEDVTGRAKHGGGRGRGGTRSKAGKKERAERERNGDTREEGAQTGRASGWGVRVAGRVEAQGKRVSGEADTVGLTYPLRACHSKSIH